MFEIILNASPHFNHTKNDFKEFCVKSLKPEMKSTLRKAVKSHIVFESCISSNLLEQSFQFSNYFTAYTVARFFCQKDRLIVDFSIIEVHINCSNILQNKFYKVHAVAYAGF